MTNRFKDLAGATVVFLASIVAICVLLWPVRTDRPPWIRDINNLKQIDVLCRLYGEDHEGRYPNDWTELASYNEYGPDIFVTLDNRESAGNLTNVMEWTDYVYIPGRTASSPPDAIVAFLPPGHYFQKGRTWAIVLFVDGHVERMSITNFTRAMNKNVNKALHPTLSNVPDG